MKSVHLLFDFRPAKRMISKCAPLALAEVKLHLVHYETTKVEVHEHSQYEIGKSAKPEGKGTITYRDQETRFARDNT